MPYYPPASSGSGAPTDATYITQTANGTLSAEQALGALATGYLKATTTTGVVASQAVPIPSADGGTGVANAGTLTNASNTTITGGGTVALGGFTLTVPATGTAALRGVANTFTQPQTFGPVGNNPSMVVHAADQVPFMAEFYNDTFSTGTPIFNYYGLNDGTFGMGTPSNEDFYLFTGSYANRRLTITGTGEIGVGTASPQVLMHIHTQDTGTNTTVRSLAVSHGVIGTAAAGCGAQIEWVLDSTTTAYVKAANFQVAWKDATHATRKAEGYGMIWDTAERNWIRWEATGTAPAIGFLGIAPIVRQTIAANATDLATAITLANDIKSKLQSFGLFV